MQNIYSNAHRSPQQGFFHSRFALTLAFVISPFFAAAAAAATAA